MRLYGLRLLVALLTFAAGVAASLLFGLLRAPASDNAAPRPTYVFVAAPAPDNPPPRHACRDYAISGGILNGKAVSMPRPAYPPAAKAAGIEGTVAVFVIVDESGRVSKTEVRSGPPLLRDAAADAARQAVFAPTRLSGEPVKVSGLLTYEFVPE